MKIEFKLFLQKFVVGVSAFLTLIMTLGVSVNAGTTANIVMNYKGTNYTKVIYDVEADQIIAGAMTPGLTNIGEMCDNVSVVSGGTVQINKGAVIATVKNLIAAGNANIYLDLTQFEVKTAVTSNAPAGGVAATPAVPSAPEKTSAALTNPATATLSAAAPSTAVLAPPAKPAAYSKAMMDYFGKSVFVGDSIMVGFRNYATRSKGTCFSDAKFLANESYSLRNGLREKSKLHPTYNGAKRTVWESIKLMDVDRVFIMFGMNDISIVGSDQTCSNYVEFVKRIKAAKPGIQVNIISMTNIMNGHEKPTLNNAGVREFNIKLEALCKANGWGFCNLAPYLVDANGGLATNYCSDKYVHMTGAAYSDVWAPVIYQYGLTH